MKFITYELDEAYPFRITNSVLPLSKGYRIDIAVSGTATIAVESPDNWWLHSLTLKANNGRWGKEEDKWDQPIEEEHPIYGAVKHYLYNFDRCGVDAAIKEQEDILREGYLLDEGKERAKLRRYP